MTSRRRLLTIEWSGRINETAAKLVRMFAVKAVCVPAETDLAQSIAASRRPDEVRRCGAAAGESLVALNRGACR